MRTSLSVLCLFAVLAVPNAGLAGEAKKARTTYPVTYEGGDLRLNRNKVKATFGQDAVVLAQHRHRIEVPVRDITEISCGDEVRRRLGAAVLDAVPRLRLGEAEAHYIGVAWTDNNGKGATPARVEAIFKVSGGDYWEFLGSLERLTGKKAIDTGRVPAVVRYAL